MVRTAAHERFPHAGVVDTLAAMTHADGENSALAPSKLRRTARVRPLSSTNLADGIMVASVLERQPGSECGAESTHA